MVQEILEEWFFDSKIDEKNRLNYIVLCDFFNEEKTFKCKHFKNLKKRFKKEVKKAIK